MLSPLALARRTHKAYERNVEPCVLRLFRGVPRPLVYQARNFKEYQAAARAVAALNNDWLRTTWFRDHGSTPSRVRGYCAVCDTRNAFAVDSTVCSEWEGRRVPWWTNTLSCPKCHLAARMRAALHLFESLVARRTDEQIYITEQTTPLYRQFQRRHPNLIGSEYLIDSTPKGRTNYSGFRCEDLTDLTFADVQFDHVLSFEVLEHIPDYKAALRECARVLKPGGRLFCSAPFHGDDQHTVRARINEDGSIEHLLPPEYHGDPVNPDGVLCYRYFGLELLEDLRAAGFSDASAWIYWSAKLGYLGEDRVVFVGVR